MVYDFYCDDMSAIPLRRPVRGGIDRQEYARVLSADGKFKEYVHGTYEEIEYYCDKNDVWVGRYLNHVDPMVVQSKFKYVGSGANPCEVAKPIYKRDEEGNFIGYTVFKEKF